MSEMKMLPAYVILTEKEKLATERILEEIKGFFREDVANDDPLSIPISHYPGDKAEYALERYFVDVATWKSFRIIASGNVAYAVLSASMDCPL